MICKHCGSNELVSRGTRHRHLKSVSQYKCKQCGKYTSQTQHRHRSARILLLDIETAPMEVYAWRARQDYIQHEAVIKDISILCWAGKWLFEDEIMGQSVTPKEAINRTEESILGGIWELIDQADIIVTQNGIDFDMKILNGKFLIAGYPKPSHYLNVDTKKIAKEQFGFSYNKLDYLGKYLLGIDGKMKMEFNDWIECVHGNQEYLDKMLTYCKIDVAPLLEDLYLKFLPWINHPNLNLFTNHDNFVCPNCESEDLKWGEKYITPQGLWRGFRCNSCGALGRGTTKKDYAIRTVSIKSN